MTSRLFVQMAHQVLRLSGDAAVIDWFWRVGWKRDGSVLLWVVGLGMLGDFVMMTRMASED